MVAMAFHAVRTAVLNKGVDVEEVWVWSECLGAVQALHSVPLDPFPRPFLPHPTHDEQHARSGACKCCCQGHA